MAVAATLLLCSSPNNGQEEKPKAAATQTKCSGEFVEGTHQADPDCNPKTQPSKVRCTAKLYKLIYPGSKYDDAAGRKLADDEIKRTTDFYAKYCIDLTFEEFKLDDKAAREAKDRYARWYADVIDHVGGKEKLGKSTISGNENFIFKTTIANAIQVYADGNVKPKGRKLVVVFMDEYIGGSDGRDTLVSATQEGSMQIGINWVDSGSQFILAHELIHLLGKPGSDLRGAVTWPHSSNCPPAKPTSSSGAGEALSKIGRTDSRVTIDLSGRYLDIAEYEEIGKSRAAQLLTCQRIK